MTIQDKFDTILKTNKLGIKSIFGLETFTGVGVGSVSKFLNKGKSPTIGTIKKIQEVAGINPAWWDTGKGEIFKELISDDIKKEETGLDEIGLLIKSIDRMSDFNAHLLEKVRELEKKLDQCLNK